MKLLPGSGEHFQSLKQLPFGLPEKGDRLPRRPLQSKLLTNAQLGNQGAVTVDVLVCQVVQHLAALTNHHQQTTTGVVVVLVYAQMVGQLVDAGSQDGNLNFGRAGVALVSRILQDNLGLLFLLNHGIIHLYNYFPVS